MKTESKTLAIVVLACLLISCGQESINQASLEPPPVGNLLKRLWNLRRRPGRGCGRLENRFVRNQRICRQKDVELLTGGFNAVLGPRGSPIDLIINSMFPWDHPQDFCRGPSTKRSGT